MPEEDKKLVPIDTSGPDAEVDIEEEKDESVVETEGTEQETGTDKSYENERETKLEEGGQVKEETEKKDDEQ